MKHVVVILVLAHAAVARADSADEARPFHLAASLKGGVVLPGTISPYTILLTATGVAPYFGADAQLGWKYFATAFYAQVAPMSGPPTLYGKPRGTSNYTVVSIGTAPKAQLPLLDELLILRAGLHLGLNVTLGHAEFTGGSVLDTVGVGFDSGPTIEASFRVASFFRLVAQFSFFSQFGGATLSSSDGKSYSYPFAPFFFFAVGPELLR